MNAPTETDSKSECGQTMAEYAVVLGLISIATLGALGLLAGQIASLIEAVVDTIGF